MLNRRVDLIHKLSQENLDHIENAFLRNRFGSKSLRDNTRQQIADRRDNNVSLFSCFDNSSKIKKTDEREKKAARATSFREKMSKFQMLRPKSNDFNKTETPKQKKIEPIEIQSNDHSKYESISETSSIGQKNLKLSKQNDLLSTTSKPTQFKLPEIQPSSVLDVNPKMVESKKDTKFPSRPNEKDIFQTRNDNTSSIIQSKTEPVFHSKGSKKSSSTDDDVKNEYLESEQSDAFEKKIKDSTIKSTSLLKSSRDSFIQPISPEKKTHKTKFWSSNSKTHNSHKEKHSNSWFKKFYGITPIHEKSGSFEFLNDSNSHQGRKDECPAEYSQCNDIVPSVANKQVQTLDRKSKRKTVYVGDLNEDQFEEILIEDSYSSDPNLYASNSLMSNEPDLKSSSTIFEKYDSMDRSLKTPSFVGVLEDFERTVQMLKDEGHLSDSEVYSNRRKSLSKSVSKSSNRLSSSFGELASPRILREESVKPSTMTSDFFRQLNSLILEKKIYGSSSSSMAHGKSNSGNSYHGFKEGESNSGSMKISGKAERLGDTSEKLQRKHHIKAERYSMLFSLLVVILLFQTSIKLSF